jgi:putative aldouronate transport system substrate-binding protein
MRRTSENQAVGFPLWRRAARLSAYAAIFLAGTMAISGCARHASKEGTVTPSGIDISKRVELVVYMLGDAPKDLDLVEAEINKMSLADLNCTVSFKYTSWSDYMQRYSLLLASGQPIDLIFTSEWLNYNQFAKKGAFIELDELLPRYAPNLYSFVPNDYWNAVRIGSHIYTIPSTWKEYVNEGFMYREDLRKEYGLPVPDTLANIEAYLEGIRKRDPGRNITSEIAVDNGFGPSFSAMSVLNLKYRWVDLCMPYGLRADYDKPGELTPYWGSKDFVDDMKMFKRWAGKGFWTKSALSNKNPMNDLFNSGYSIAVMSGINPIKYAHSLAIMKSRDPGVEVGYYPYCRSTKLVKPVHPTHNGFAIPLGAANPERALMFYEKLVLDRRYNRLTQYGIEGKHYSVDKDGFYEMIGTADTNGLPHEAMNGWAWRNPELMIFDRNASVAFDLFKEFDGYAQPDIFYGFVEDYSSYQAERAALYQVQSQYLVPIQAGMVDDVDRAVKEFMAQANAAGLQKIQREYKRQWLAYCAEKGIK